MYDVFCLDRKYLRDGNRRKLLNSNVVVIDIS